MTNSPLKQSVRLVQSSFAKGYLMKAKFWENIYRKAYGFSSGLAIPNHFQLEESRMGWQTLPASPKALEISTFYTWGSPELF
jgi:hypothetical protein